MRVALFSAIALTFAIGSLTAQVIPEAVSCARCSITTRVIAQIGEKEGRGSLPGRPMGVLVDGRGRYWVVPLDNFPMIYDARGVFVQEFGRRGDGPGEFRVAFPVTPLPGDSMLVRDIRKLVVIGPDLAVARSIRAPSGFGDIEVIDWPRRAITLYNYYQREGGEMNSGMATALIDLSADSIPTPKPFLSIPSGRDPIAYANSGRVLGPARGDHSWIAYRNRYRLVRYNAAGIAVDSLERAPSWFPGGKAMQIPGPDRPASPMMIGLWADQQGRIWTLTAQPRPEFRWERPPGNEISVAAMPSESEQFKTMVEVIDPRARRVIARLVIDAFAQPVSSGNRIAVMKEDELGIPTISILELTLTGER